MTGPCLVGINVIHVNAYMIRLYETSGDVVFVFDIVVCDNKNIPLIIENYIDNHGLCSTVIPFLQELSPFPEPVGNRNYQTIVVDNVWVPKTGM